MASDQSTKQKREEAKQPLAPEHQREGISKRGHATHADGQGTGGTPQHDQAAQPPAQGTKRGGQR